MRKRTRQVAPVAEVEQNAFHRLPTDVAVFVLSFLSVKERFVFTGLSRSLRRLLTARSTAEVNRALFPLTVHVGFAVNLAAATRAIKSVTQKAHLVPGSTVKPPELRCLAFGDGYLFAGEKIAQGGPVHRWEVEAERWSDVVYRTGKSRTNVNSLKCANSRLFVGLSRPTCAVHCFDVATGNELCEFGGHRDSVFAIAVNQTRMISGGGQTDTEAKAFDLETQKLLWKCKHKGSVRGLDATENMLASTSLGGELRWFDLRSMEETGMVKFSGDTVHGLQIMTHGSEASFVVSAGRPGCSVYTVDARNPKPVLIARHMSAVSSVVANAYVVAAADYDGLVSVTRFSEPLFSVWSSRNEDGRSSEIHALAACGPNQFAHCDGSNLVIKTFE